MQHWPLATAVEEEGLPVAIVAARNDGENRDYVSVYHDDFPAQWQWCQCRVVVAHDGNGCRRSGRGGLLSFSSLLFFSFLCIIKTHFRGKS